MNTRQYKKLRTCKSACDTQLLVDESIVQNGLAVTPAQMLRMAEKGVPIAPANLPENSYSETDNTSDNDFSVNMEFKRGVDLNTLWENEIDIKQKFRNARKDKDAWKTLEKGE